MIARDGSSMGLAISSHMDEIHTSVKAVVLRVVRRCHVLKLGCADDTRGDNCSKDSGCPLTTSGDITNRLFVVLSPSDTQVLNWSAYIIVWQDFRNFVLGLGVFVPSSFTL